MRNNVVFMMIFGFFAGFLRVFVYLFKFNSGFLCIFIN